MNFQTHNDNDSITPVGTSLQYRNHEVGFDRIVAVFGEPDCNDEWAIRFDDGKTVTIYPWPSNAMNQYNIGGPDKWTAYRVIDLLNGTNSTGVF